MTESSSTAAVPPKPDTRQRLISAMRSALRRRGLHGVGLTELLAEAGAPKGVLYHHFPGGKTALAVAAIEDSVQKLCAQLDRLLAGGSASNVLRGWIGAAGARLEDTGYATGCPLAAVALESTPDDAEIRVALALGFAELRLRIAAALVREGQPQAQAEALAALIVSAYEGGLMQARVAQSIEPMRQVGRGLELLLAGFAAQPGPQYVPAQGAGTQETHAPAISAQDACRLDAPSPDTPPSQESDHVQ